MRSRAALGIALIVLASLALAACGGSDDAAALEDRIWILASYGGQALLSGTEVTLEFDGEAGEISGNAGCNHYFGGYEASGEELTFSTIGMTEMYCMDPEGLMDQEQAYLAALGNAERFEVDDGTLRIFYAGGQVLKFQAR